MGWSVNSTDSLKVIHHRVIRSPETAIFAKIIKPWFNDLMKNGAMTFTSDDANLQLQMPAETKRALALMAADTGIPMRLLVLTALKDAGYPVPQEALVDRRKSLP